MADNLPHSSADVTESGSLNLPEPSGPHRPVMGLLYLYFMTLENRTVYEDLYIYFLILLIPLVTQSKALVCDRSVAGIMGSTSAGDMEASVL
jgi:hypothetical protein